MDPAARTPVRHALNGSRTARRPTRPPRAQLPARRLRGAGWFDAATLTLALVVAAGVAVRVALWWQDRAFWRDELALVQSLDTYPAGRLLGPLSDAQSAPPLWLLAVRAVTIVAGDGERAYRLVALGCGCATLVVMALLAVRLVRHRWAAVVPMVLVATISELVYYTAQTKQYATDTFAVTLLLLLGVRVLNGDGRVRPGSPSDPHRRDALWWYACLAVLPWVSHGFMLTAPLVAGWVTLVLLRRRTHPVRSLAGRLAVPAVSVLGAAVYARHLTGQVGDLETYWAPFLGPAGEGPRAWWDWHGFVFRELAVRELGFATWWPGLLVVAGLMIVAGFGVALRRQPSSALLLVLPLVTAYATGVLGIYPFGRRLVLFCVPGLLVCAGVLVDAVAGRVAAAIGRWSDRPGAAGPGPVPSSWVPRLAAGLAGVAAGALVLVACWTSPTRLVHDLTYLYGVDDYRGALRLVGQEWQNGDVLVVGNGDRAAVRVYGPRLYLRMEHAYRAMPTLDETVRADCSLPRPLTSARRLWLLTGDVVPVYAGTPSRTALAAPFLRGFRSVWQRDKGLVTVRLFVPGRTPGAGPARCLDYARVGVAGDLAFPPALPES